MARGRRKSKSSTLELVPDAWERFEKFVKSIVAPSPSKTKAKSGSKRKASGSKTGSRKTGSRKAGGRKAGRRKTGARGRKAARKGAASE